MNTYSFSSYRLLRPPVPPSRTALYCLKGHICPIYAVAAPTCSESGEDTAKRRAGKMNNVRDTMGDVCYGLAVTPRLAGRLLRLVGSVRGVYLS